MLTTEVFCTLTIIPQKPAAVSPVMELPHDIMFEIFSSCLSKKAVQLPLRRTTVPWNLTHVCSTWRLVAMGMPNLWNNVAVAFHCGKEAKWAVLKDMLDLFLSRTRKSLISLKIVAEGLVDAHPFWRSIIDLLLPYIGQFRHLSLNPSEAFSLLLESKVDALESADLEFSERFNTHPNISNMTFFDKACNLRRIAISSNFADLDLNTFHISWTHLSHLHLVNTYPKFIQGHAVLRQCASLVSLALDMIPDIECHGVTCATILPKLEFLKIVICAGQPCGQFLQPFILPSLKRFEVDSIGTYSRQPDLSAVALTQLVQRSSCQLKRFEATALAPSVLTALLTVAPSLTRLSLHNLKIGRFREPSHDQHLFSAVACGNLLPNLQIIECNLFDLEHVIDTVEMRSRIAPFRIPPCTPIRSMIIRGYPGGYWQSVQGSLSGLRTRGVNIIFRDITLDIVKKSLNRTRHAH